MLVYRPDMTSFAWWHEAGGFQIKYPNYSWYVDSNTMLYEIARSNKLMLDYACQKRAAWSYFTPDWIKENLKDKLYKSIFSPNLHLPAFGIYNKQTNHFLFVGIGKKNIIFSFCSDSKIELKNANHFCQFDYGLVIQQLVNSLTIAAEFHEILCTSGVDPDSKKAYSLFNKYDLELEKIRLAIPKVTDDMNLLSPCSF